MQEKLIIDDTLLFGFDDLMLEVDFDHEFTFGDLIGCIDRSRIYTSLPELLRCNYLYEFLDEAKNETERDDEEDNMEYLELYYGGETHDDIEEDCGLYWDFHGVGKEGYVPDDMKEHGEWEEGEMDTYRQAFAIEMSPINELCKYPVKVRATTMIGKWEGKEYSQEEINTRPPVTLMELLYNVFWELSFFGSPEHRDKQTEELKRRCEEFELARENGTLKTSSHEEVVERLSKKLNDMKDMKSEE